MQNWDSSLLCLFQSAAIVVSFKTTIGPFVGLEVIVEITLPSEYPFKAPDVRFSCISIPASCRSLITVWSVMESTLASLQAKFLSPMFHPNVSKEGQVCKVTASTNWWYIATQGTQPRTTFRQPGCLEWRLGSCKTDYWHSGCHWKSSYCTLYRYCTCNIVFICIYFFTHY